MKFLKDIKDWKECINEVVCGDCLGVLKTLPNESVDMVMTSPPYWALRDYGVEGQLGLEPTFQEYINKLCDIFDEVRRVLKKEGTCWVNLGDTYASGIKGQGGSGCNLGPTGSQTQLSNAGSRFSHKVKTDTVDKCLLQIPSRFAIEMCNRGWILRNEIIWHKPNCMPSSVKDRFTVDFEKIFFFTKSKKYYFETQYEEALTKEKRPSGIVRERTFGYDGKYPYAIQPRTKPFVEVRDLPEIKTFSKWLNHWRKAQSITIDRIETEMESQAPHHWFNGESYPSVKEWNVFKKLYNPPQDYDKQLLNVELKSSEKRNHEQGRNKRCVWSITTKPYKEAHFATYPEALCETPIKSGCPVDGIVLDTFFGSGTTGLVAKKLRRDFIGIELNPMYVKIAEERLRQEILF